ncbi:transposase [[Phormidium ambiguum] IAM M-71]|nr:transposase [Phormidium ambiguum]
MENFPLELAGKIKSNLVGISRMVNDLRSDYDSAWKEALTVYFEPFMAFCFADAHTDINWERGYETLDTELQEVIRDAEIGRRLADKLVKVWLNSGEDALVLIHVEIQGQVQTDFAERMYVYNHRLFDRYRQKVFSFAVLGDENSNWRPTSYSYHRWGFHSSLQFPIIKLLDYRIDKLEESTNPFAIIIAAHLETQATRNDLQRRFQSKLSLVRRLYERGYTKNQILELFRFIEWMMILPDTIQQQFKFQIRRIEEEKQMPYITSFERDAKLEIARESVIKVLETRFLPLPDALIQRINSGNDIELLKQLLVSAVTINSVEEFGQMLTEIQGE